MNRRTLLCCTLLLATGVDARRPPRLSKKQCKALKRRMQNLQSKLRAGYTAKQGRRYRAKMRELQLEKFRRCR